MDIADYVMLAILVFSAWDGYRSGLVKQLVRLFGTVLSYIVAWQFHGLVTPTILGFVRSTILKNVHSVRSVPIVGLIDSAQTVSTLSLAIANALAFGITFYVALIVIRLLGRLLDTFVSLPVLSFVNRSMGLIAGGVVAFLLIAVLIDVASYIPSSPVKSQVQKSALAPMFQQPVQELARLEGIVPGAFGAKRG